MVKLRGVKLCETELVVWPGQLPTLNSLAKGEQWLCLWNSEVGVQKSEVQSVNPRLIVFWF